MGNGQWTSRSGHAVFLTKVGKVEGCKRNVSAGCGTNDCSHRNTCFQKSGISTLPQAAAVQLPLLRASDYGLFQLFGVALL